MVQVLDFIKKTPIPITEYYVIRAEPAIGIIYVINNFISGHVRLLGRRGGAYPHKYLEMIDAVFGKLPASDVIEVCSGTVKDGAFTVDSEANNSPLLLGDAQILEHIDDNSFKRWRCDPPYNEKTAKEYYQCELPSLMKLLKAGARVVKRKSLLFLLCTQNYQHCPPTLKRIGLILITVVPNNEIRALNIYTKL